MTRKRNTTRSSRENNNLIPLEPRVAQLESGLDRLTDDVANLASVVREQSNQMEQEIQKLVVAVTQASGPRKTDWMTIITGIMLIMAIGSAVFWPLSQQVSDNRATIDKVETRLTDNVKAQELRTESQQQTILSVFRNDMDSNKKLYDAQVQSLNDRIKGIEDFTVKSQEKDRDELSLWRQKAMNLNSAPTKKFPFFLAPGTR